MTIISDVDNQEGNSLQSSFNSKLVAVVYCYPSKETISGLSASLPTQRQSYALGDEDSTPVRCPLRTSSSFRAVCRAKIESKQGIFDASKEPTLFRDAYLSNS